MTVSLIAAILRRVGASLEEADDLSDVMYLNGWYALSPGNQSQEEAARTYLDDWRAEKRAIAAEIRLERQRRILAGIRLAKSVDAPVYLNGATAW